MSPLACGGTSPGTTTDSGSTTETTDPTTDAPTTTGTTEPDTTGTTGTVDFFPETCLELLTEVPGAEDGQHTLYIGKDPVKPWDAHCHDMAGEPREFLTLIQVGPALNFSQYTAGGSSPGTDVRTTFTRVRIDPITLRVDIDDLTFSTSQGSLEHGGAAVTTMPFGVAMDCQGMATGAANIDLTGTPFRLSDPFCVAGAGGMGEAVLSQDDQVAVLTGGGLCGWASPKPDDGCAYNPHEHNNGAILDLAYIEP